MSCLHLLVLTLNVALPVYLHRFFSMQNNFDCRDNVLGTGLSLESNYIFYGIQPAQPAQLPKQKHNILPLKLNAFSSDKRGFWESEVTVIG